MEFCRRVSATLRSIVLGALTAAASASLTQAPALADDGTLRLYGEPTSFTNVVDAFDDDDVFDLSATVGFSRRLTDGTIEREDPRADGRTTRNFTDIARASRVENILNLGVEVGLYKDLAVYARVPITLSDDRELKLPGGRDAAEVAADLAIPTSGGSEQLFTVPFTSPTRSGIDHVDLGAAYAVMNQYRTPSLPTWVWLAELSLGIGAAAHPCFGTKPDSATAQCYGGGDAGTGSSLSGLRIETRASKRFRFLEPYTGFSFLYRWAGQSSDLFTTGGDLPGYVETLPPMEAGMTVGATAFPWESRGRFQRLAIDARFLGTWVTRGRDYTPLTDALGTSQASALRTPVKECPTCTAEDEYVGLGETAAHARLGGQLSLELQAAKVVRFVLGANLSYATPYLITGTEPCNLSGGGAGDPRAGSCESGIQNPHYRAVIDGPGQRFRVRGELVVDLFANAVAQF